MYAYTQLMHRASPRPQARPVSTRAAFGIWAMISVGGWVVVAGVLRALGIL